MGKTAKKNRVGRQNKNNIIWFLGSVFLKKYFANTEEKPAIYNLL